jgi:hypothetical protein
MFSLQKRCQRWLSYSTPAYEITILLTTTRKEATAHRCQHIVSEAALVVCSASVVVAVGELVASAPDKTIVDRAADESAAEDCKLLRDGMLESIRLLYDIDEGVGAAAEEGEPASPGTFVSPVGVALAVAFSPPIVLDAMMVVDFAGLGVGRLLGRTSALSPVQSAWPPSFTTIPTPAMASPSPLSFWNCVISKVSSAPGSCRSVISFLAGFMYIRKLYCRLSPFSPTEPGETYSRRGGEVVLMLVMSKLFLKFALA